MTALPWVIVGAAFVVLLLLDLRLADRTSGSPRSAALWSVVWFGVGLAVTGAVWAWHGSGAGVEYLTGFLIERSLSLDNLFVFLMIFQALAVPAVLRERVLVYGIIGAIVLRLIFIAVGAALLDLFSFTLYVFGAILIATAIKMVRHSESEIDPERTLAVRAFKRLMPVRADYGSGGFLAREGGRLVATPLAIALVMVAAFDLVFAVDSIPAIFAVTRDAFIVFAANAFALLGLRPLYTLLADWAERFRYLHYGLALVLAWVGLKMILAQALGLHVPVAISLAVIVVAIGLSILISFRATRTPPTVPA